MILPIFITQVAGITDVCHYALPLVLKIFKG
jgi:hypothetical protein